MVQTATIPADIRLMNGLTAVLMAVFALLVLLASLRWGVRHPAFAIHAIELRGELKHTNALTLRANVAPQLAGTFFTMDLDRARAAVESVPWVRHAVVRRQFPNRLSVQLQEHQAAAFWGEEDSLTLVNSFGELFEGNTGDVELSGLPVLAGPSGESALILQAYEALQPQYERLDLSISRLELTSRGGWRARLDSGAAVELGRGTPAELAARNEVFMRTVTQVAADYQRGLSALESADLRYAQGYAIKLRGVATVDTAALAALGNPPAATPGAATGAAPTAAPAASAPTPARQ
jgi:cell division protein FtsQ